MPANKKKLTNYKVNVFSFNGEIKETLTSMSLSVGGYQLMGAVQYDVYTI